MNLMKMLRSMFVLSLLIAVTACRYFGKPSLTYRLVIPEGYVGWVRVDFGVDSAPAVFKRSGRHEVAVIKVGEDGRARTSDLEVILAPKTEYEFFYATSAGLKRVPEELVSHDFQAGGISARADDYSQPIKPYSWYFFIGPNSYRTQHPKSEFLDPGAPLPVPGRIRQETRCGLANSAKLNCTAFHRINPSGE